MAAPDLDAQQLPRVGGGQAELTAAPVLLEIAQLRAQLRAPVGVGLRGERLVDLLPVLFAEVGQPQGQRPVLVKPCCEVASHRGCRRTPDREAGRDD